MHRAADKEAARKRDQSKAKCEAASAKARLRTDDATDGAEASGGERARRVRRPPAESGPLAGDHSQQLGMVSASIKSYFVTRFSPP